MGTYVLAMVDGQKKLLMQGHSLLPSQAVFVFICMVQMHDVGKHDFCAS